MPLPGVRSALGWLAVATLATLVTSACSRDSPPPRNGGANTPAAPAPPPDREPAPASPGPPSAPPPPNEMPRAEEPPPSPPVIAPSPAPALPAFEWPPPRYSAFVEIPRAWIAPSEASLGSVADRLERAFDAAGYAERSYFWIPGGFALASRIETIRDDAAPAEGAERWAVEMDRPPQGFVDYIRALFDARPGLYRVIVFAATNEAVSAGEHAPSSSEARSWMYRGLLQLPASVRKLSYESDHHTIALIYEFEQPPDRSGARVRQPSSSPGRVHLQKSGLLRALGPP